MRLFLSCIKRGLPALALFCWITSGRAERINHAGRLLGPAPVVTNATLFNTTNADAVLAAMQIFPVSNPWNEDISSRPLLPNSDAMIAQITADLASTRRSLRAFKEMNFVLVPDNQPSIPINFFDYPDESDLDGGTLPTGLYPIPPNLPVETWPSETGGLTLSQWQQDVNGAGGDRHAIIVKPGAGFLWETWQAKLVAGNWEASNGAKFNLHTNSLRPAGWTSGDAAGLPMFPALVRFDECERGVVEHALRIVVAKSRKEYIYPATHYAATTPATQTNVPAMGQRVRLKSGFIIPANWTRQEKAVLTALKKYGALVADNGNFFSISVTPDDRWPAGCFDHLNTVGITNFEVIQTTGPAQGPRSPGAPVVNAGADRSAFTGIPLPLTGLVTYTGTPPLVVQWHRYSGPTNLTFTSATQPNPTVTFDAPGNYTLMLSASNGVHPVAYDAVMINVSPALIMQATQSGADLHLAWAGGTPPFVVERTTNQTLPAWSSALTTSAQSVSFPITPGPAFFRIRCSPPQ